MINYFVPIFQLISINLNYVSYKNLFFQTDKLQNQTEGSTCHPIKNEYFRDSLIAISSLYKAFDRRVVRGTLWKMQGTQDYYWTESHYT